MLFVQIDEADYIQLEEIRRTKRSGSFLIYNWKRSTKVVKINYYSNDAAQAQMDLIMSRLRQS